MNLGITGATGFIGQRLIDVALRRGHEVIAFTRDPRRQIPGCSMRVFPEDRPPDITGCEALIHLAGEPVVGLWTAAKKRRIRDSRVQGTRRVVEAIASASAAPEVFISGSAIGFYGNRGEEELTENSGPGSGFLAECSIDWEAEALKAVRTRVVLVRTAIVLGREGGALRSMLPIFRAGLGGRIGSGRQWMSWIHIEDQVRLLLFALENMEVRGPLNASAPWPARNADFTRALAHAVGRPALLPVPAAFLWPLGEFRHELLDSKKVLPAAALDYGFGFRHSELPKALKDLLG